MQVGVRAPTQKLANSQLNNVQVGVRAPTQRISKDKRNTFSLDISIFMHEFHACILLSKYILAMTNDKELETLINVL